MTCHEVQTNLSLYLYGELDFAREEELEIHLGECAFCQRSLAREKTWHTSLNSGRRDVPLDLLANSRQELRSALGREAVRRPSAVPSLMSLWRWRDPLAFLSTRWSAQVAMASFLLFAGFAIAKWIDKNGLPSGLQAVDTVNMGLINPATSRIRDIQSSGPDHVRLIVEQIRESEVTGSVDDEKVRALLLAAAKESNDPGIRVDSVEMLNSQSGADVRDALLYSVRHDTNAGVRLKALEGLRRFPSNAETRDALKFVLEHDENACVRSQAIDVLAPADRKLDPASDLAGTLQDIIRSGRDDDYVHGRCVQALHGASASSGAY
jgi:hypothetical protein